MNSINPSYLASFWSAPMVEVNLLIFMNLAGALAPRHGGGDGFLPRL